MTKARLLELIHAANAELLAELNAMPGGAQFQPGAGGGWSIKDHIAHLAAWQDLLGGWLERASRGESPRPMHWPEGTIDHMNGAFHAEHRDESAAAGLAALQRSHERAVAAIAAFGDVELNDPHRFAWWDGEPILTLIAGNTYEHIAEHLTEIRAQKANQA